MNYYIVAVDKDNKELLGTQNQTLVYEAKNMVKVNNALKSFNPDKRADKVRVYSYTNLYDDKTHKLVRTINL